MPIKTEADDPLILTIYHASIGAKLRQVFIRPLNGVFRIPALWLAVALFAPAPASAWEYWGGDRGGSRFSPLNQITPDNVGNLVRAWEFSTGDLDRRAPELMKRTKFQATPLLVEDSLIFCSPFNEVIALDPGSGVQKWRYDTKISTSPRPANPYNCRGVGYLVVHRAPGTPALPAPILGGTDDPP